MRTTALIRATGLTAVLGSLAFAVPAQAATTVGNNLAATPTTVSLCDGSIGCTLVPASLAPEKGTLTTVTGVVVRWRVKAAAAARTSIALRVVRGNTAVGTSAAQTLTAPGISTFPTRLAVVAGDRLGIDAFGVNPPIAAFPGGTVDRWSPPLGETETRPPTDQRPFELLLNADIEADADRDAWGDETQDRCVGQAGPQNGCPAPPPPPPTTTPPPATTPPPPPANTSTPIGGTPAPSGATAPTATNDSIAPPVNAAPRITSLLFNATRISFRISEPASVSLLVQRVLPGKRVGARCVKPTRRNRAARKCNLLVRAVTGRTDVDSGLNTARLRRLPPGRYRVRLLSTDLTDRTAIVIRYFRLRG